MLQIVHSDARIQLSLQSRLMTQSLLHVQLMLAMMCCFTEHLVFSLIRDSLIFLTNSAPSFGQLKNLDFSAKITKPQSCF